MTNKPKEPTPEQKAKAKELRQKAKEIQRILKNETIDQAEMMVSMLAVEIDRIFSDRKLKVKVKDLDIQVEKGQENTEALIKLIEELSVTEAVMILYGFDNQIKGALRKLNEKKKLEELDLELL